MQSLDLYQVDAFADKPFEGNPAAVAPLGAWLPDETLQSIAAENNLSETAFFVPSSTPEFDFHLRWFTPAVEVDLCGHATLASAHVLFEHLGFPKDTIRFTTQSGLLTVTRVENQLSMVLPARPGKPTPFNEAAARALGGDPKLFLKARDLMAVYHDAAEVRALNPDMMALAKLPHFSVMATAPGDNGLDFVNRFFAPGQGVPEDPVTGSAFSTLAPYWAGRLKKSTLHARQVSKRGGNVTVIYGGGDTVELRGRAVTYLQGKIHF